jgi:hypothetical protein
LHMILVTRRRAHAPTIAYDPKFEPTAVKFVGRLIAQRSDTTIGSIHLAAAALTELRGHRRDDALRVLQRLLSPVVRGSRMPSTSDSRRQ